MTTTVTGPASGPVSTSAGTATTLHPRPGQLWRAARGPAAVLLLVLLGGLALAAVAGGRPTGYLDPRAADPSGSRAVAALLRGQGVRVDLVRTYAAMHATARPGDTLLVTAPDLLVRSQARGVRNSGADLVLAPTGSPERFLRGVRVVDAVGAAARAPGCGLPAARRAGTADAGGLAFTVDADAVGVGAAQVEQCYALDGKPSLVQVQQDNGRRTTLLGNAAVLTNDRLDDEGDAALALGLLGGHERLVWYLPTPGDVPAGEQRSLYALVPDRVWWALVQVGVAVLVLALWRARRLGPIVAEPLPVVVRASETMEGRGRLYRRSGARDKAAATLRAATLARLAAAFSLPRRSEPATVTAAAASRTGRPGVEVEALLYGAAPADDAELVRLADGLDQLEREVHRP